MTATSTLKYRPLYKQIKSLILQRVIDGVWAPGNVLPSEQQLGQEFGVSQGTIRKALDEMTTENIFVRKQGKGTFVSQHSANRSLFHFFYISRDDGKRTMPDSKVISVTQATSHKMERERLQLNVGQKVVRLKRIRFLEQKPIIVETIALPANIFKNFAKIEIPNTLYELYESQYEVQVIKAVELLKAVSVNQEDAAHLGLEVGAPVLEIDRVAISLKQQPVEWRLSYVDTRNYRYLSELT